MKPFALLFYLSIMILPKTSYAQSISGRIIDELSQPLPFANIILLSQNDSSYIRGTVSKDNGMFEIEITDKNCILKVSSIGYKTIYANIQLGNIGNIQMQPETYTMGGVTVTGHRPQIKISDEGMVVNVQNSLLRQAGTADDVLSQIPRISGSNGSFNVFGKGKPLIYINNRKITNPSELSQLKSSDIKDVEVITNPGAQYGGIVQSVIRIKTIKQRDNGWSLSSYSFVNMSRKFSPMESFNIKYKHNNLELFGNIRIHSLHNKQYAEFEQIMQGDHLVKEIGKDTIFNNGDKQLRGQFGGSIDFNENNSFGMTYSVTKSLHDIVNSVSTLDFSMENSIQEKVRMKSAFTSYHTPDHELDAYYTGKVGKLSVDINGSYFRSKQTKTQSNEEYSSILGLQFIDVNNIVRNKMLAGKIILTYPIWIGKLNLGSEYSDAQSEANNNNVQRIFENTNTKIKEKNIAGFFDYSISIGNVHARAGLRYEHVVSDYFSNGIWQNEVSRKYSDWFPNISLSWSKGKWQTLIGYNAKIIRPSYRNLSSWMQYDNRYEYQGGNPLLRSAKIHSIDLTAKRNWLTFTAGYKYTKNQVAYVMHPYKGDIFLKTYDNIDQIQNLYVMVSASPKIGFYQPMYEASVTKQFFDDNKFGAGLSLNRPLYSL
ncbi:MAG: outer membrane beta-barrel protein, partial [Prevotella bivia]|nr:outer membrane beta-barrel protein [Prevotella bivia]